MQTNYFTRVEGNWSPYDDVVLEELMRFYKSYELVAEHGLLHFTRSFSQDQIKRRWEKILYNGKTSSLSRLHMPTESRLLKRAVSEPFSEGEDKIIRIHIIEKEMKAQEKNKDNNKNGEEEEKQEKQEKQENEEKQEKQEQQADDDIAMEVGEKNVGEKQKEEFVEADNNSNEKKTHETRTTHGLKDFALLLTKFEREFHPNRTPFCLQQRYLHLLRERRAGNTANNNNNNKKKNNKNNEVVGVKGQWDLPALEAALVRSIGGGKRKQEEKEKEEKEKEKKEEGQDGEEVKENEKKE